MGLYSTPGKWILISFLLLMSVYGNSQTLEELRKRKQSAAEEIRYTSELLGKISQNQKATLGKLRLLSSQIEQRNRLISTMNSEVAVIQELINDNAQVVEMLSSDLEKIKQEYAQMVRFAWKNRNAYDKVLFFLSAENVNQAYRRFVYVRQYTDFRRKQVETISSIQNILLKKMQDLENQQNAKKEVISEKERESRLLSTQKNQQSTVARNLMKQQSELKSKLARQRKIEQQLEREIQKIIEEEARKAVQAGKTGYGMTPEQKLTGTSFEQNKHRIPWPVEKGIIIEKFGIHPHPVLSNITVNNNGVNIATDAGAQARAVFNGEVSRVFGITGGNSAVILRHGQYLTVYSNLEEVRVRKGDQVSLLQNLGTIFSDMDDGNKTILKFQIWKENQKLNPEEWLTR
jgi:septal ring factor EnvC (AmiA/AmiB activator)